MNHKRGSFTSSPITHTLCGTIFLMLHKLNYYEYDEIFSKQIKHIMNMWRWPNFRKFFTLAISPKKMCQITILSTIYLKTRCSGFLRDWSQKSCSCPLVRCFRTLFLDDIMIIWDENIVYFVNWLFWNNKKFLYLIFINKL